MISLTANHVALAVALPLLAAFLLTPISRVSVRLAKLVGLVTLIAVIVILMQLGALISNGPVSVALGGFAPPLGINFVIDDVSLLFASLVAWGGLLFWPWKDDQASVSQRDAALILLMTAAGIGLTLSGDLFNLYVFYELLSVASFGLVAAKASGAGFAASLRFLLLSGLGSVMALVGIALIYTQTGTLNLAQLATLAPEALNSPLGLAAFALILIGVGVKAELFAVNSWVPEVYATAPTRTTALLAGVMSKVAVLVILRVMLLLYSENSDAHLLLLVLGILGVLSGELAALHARDLTRMLSYSSIAQLGLIFIAFSVSGEAGLIAGMALMLHHLVVKSGLFLLAERWNRGLDQLEGAAHSGGNTFWAALLLTLFALSLIGVPPLPGFWAKLSVVTALANADGVYLFGLAAILIATVIEANYLFTLVVRLFRRNEHITGGDSVSGREHGALNLMTATALATVLVIAAIDADAVGKRLDSLAKQLADSGAYVAAVNSSANAPEVSQ